MAAWMCEQGTEIEIRQTLPFFGLLHNLFQTAAACNYHWWLETAGQCYLHSCKCRQTHGFLWCLTNWKLLIKWRPIFQKAQNNHWNQYIRSSSHVHLRKTESYPATGNWLQVEAVTANHGRVCFMFPRQTYLSCGGNGAPQYIKVSLAFEFINCSTFH